MLKFVLVTLYLFFLITPKAYSSGENVSSSKMKIGILLFEKFDQLDVTGPLEVISDFPHTQIYFLSNERGLVMSVQGLPISSNMTFAQAPQMDVLLAPGGAGVTNAIQKNKELIAFIQKQTPHLKYLTSVCTGALLLGAAGELKGYQATSHWLAKKYLTSFGAIPKEGRVVVDENRITASGVTSGIDLALKLGEILFGETFAKSQELLLEYQPQNQNSEMIFQNSSPEVKTEIENLMGNTIRERDEFFRSAK